MSDTGNWGDLYRHSCQSAKEHGDKLTSPDLPLEEQVAYARKLLAIVDDAIQGTTMMTTGTMSTQPMNTSPTILWKLFLLSLMGFLLMLFLWGYHA